MRNKSLLSMFIEESNEEPPPQDEQEVHKVANNGSSRHTDSFNFFAFEFLRSNFIRRKIPSVLGANDFVNMS